MLIAQVTDTHILAPAPDRPAASLRAECLRRTIADINRQGPDAVIFTGDTVQHGRPEEYAALEELLAPLEAPLYLVPGNRDDKRVLRDALRDLVALPPNGGFFHYVVERHELRLVAVDSTLANERKGRFCEARQAWLDGVLGERPGQPTLLFIHHPPFDVGDHYVGGYRHPEEAAALTAIVSRHPQVVALVCGHVHWPIQCDWAGTRARIMPSVAVDLRKGIDESEARGRPVYMLHEYARDSGVVSRLRTVDGDG